MSGNNNENKVPHNLLKTPRGVNPAKRAGFYANEKPEVLNKKIEYVGMPRVVNCSIVDGEDGGKHAVFDKTFAEIQENDFYQVQFKFMGLNSTNRFLRVNKKGEPLAYIVYFHVINEFSTMQVGFILDSDGNTFYEVSEYPKAQYRLFWERLEEPIEPPEIEVEAGTKK